MGIPLQTGNAEVDAKAEVRTVEMQPGQTAKSRTYSVDDFTRIDVGEVMRKAGIAPPARKSAELSEQLAHGYAAMQEKVLRALEGRAVSKSDRHHGEMMKTAFLDAEGRIIGRVWLDNSDDYKITVRGEVVDPPEEREP